MERRICKDIHIVSNKLCRTLDLIMAKYDITHSQYTVLIYLIKNKREDIFQRDVEEEFEIRRSSVSAILSHLEDKGYITRSSVLYDARLKKITVTKKAECVIEESMKLIGAFERKLLSGVSEKELDIFYLVLNKLSAFVDK